MTAQHIFAGVISSRDTHVCVCVYICVCVCLLQGRAVPHLSILAQQVADHEMRLSANILATLKVRLQVNIGSCSQGDI